MTKDQLITLGTCIKNIVAATDSLLSLCNDTLNEDPNTALLLSVEGAKIAISNDRLLNKFKELSNAKLEGQAQKS